MKTDYLIPYGNCVPTRGSVRSIICDLQRGTFDYVPNSMLDFLELCREKTVGEIKKGLPKAQQGVVDSYVDFLLNKEFAFLGSREEMDFFPSISTDWDSPFAFSNIILDFHADSDTKAALQALEGIPTSILQVRVYAPLTQEKELELFRYTQDADADNVQFVLPHATWHTKQYLLERVADAPNLQYLFLHSADENAKIKLIGFSNAYKSQDVIRNCFACGIVQLSYFSPNIIHFTESLHHNTCLNRKISIDAEGYIRNCPSMPEHYGHISDTTLREALDKPGFKKYWNIKKDDISKCKDCEFRHICTDCRAYRDDPEDLYSAPLKCGYDPYTGQWEEWSENPLKKEAMGYYGFIPQ